MAISPEDEDLWKKHTKGIKRHDRETKIEIDLEEVEVFAKPKMKLSVDAEHFKMKRPPQTTEATIDLHGLTRQESYDKLCAFIDNSYKLGRKCVIVITGKGKEGVEGLKEKVPKWLDTETLSSMNIGFMQAPSNKGGAGALLVYIKKNKEL